MGSENQRLSLKNVHSLVFGSLLAVTTSLCFRMKHHNKGWHLSSRWFDLFDHSPYTAFGLSWGQNDAMKHFQCKNSFYFCVFFPWDKIQKQIRRQLIIIPFSAPCRVPESIVLSQSLHSRRKPQLLHPLCEKSGPWAPPFARACASEQLSTL